MIGGKYTHAVKKTAKKGDFRVQDDHGGKVEIYNATQSEIKFAEDCIEKCPFCLFMQELIYYIIMNLIQV